MIRGWYTGASGMNAQQNRLDAIANNLTQTMINIKKILNGDRMCRIV